MNYKQVIGLIILVIGLGIIIYASYSINQTLKTKSETPVHIEPFPDDDPLEQVEDGLLEGKPYQYDEEMRGLMTGGIVLLVIGGCVILIFRKKKNIIK